MSFDLNQLIQDNIGGALTSYATEQLGESAEVASKGVAMAIPALLGGLLKNSGDGNKMTELFNTITGPNMSGDISQVAPNLLEQGRGWLDTLLGGSDHLTQLLSDKTGMSLGNVGSLLAAALPMVLGTLRSHIQTHNLTQPQFVGLLDAQKGFLAKLLDGDFLGALGLGALGMAVGGAVTGAVSGVVGGAADAVTGATEAATDAVSAVTDSVSEAIAPVAGGASAWTVLAGSTIATVLLASFCTGKAPAPASAPVDNTAATAAATDTTAAATSASDSANNSAKDSTNNSASAADAASIKYMDGVLSVYFDTGKTDFDTALAQTVAAEIVEQGKSGKKLAVSGFNDPRGNAKLNAELSKNRAKSVKEFLIAQGVPADNVEMVKPEETTGDSGSNAENRRVDVRVQP